MVGLRVNPRPGFCHSFRSGASARLACAGRPPGIRAYHWERLGTGTLTQRLGRKDRRLAPARVSSPLWTHRSCVEGQGRTRAPGGGQHHRGTRAVCSVPADDLGGSGRAGSGRRYRAGCSPGPDRPSGSEGCSATAPQEEEASRRSPAPPASPPLGAVGPSRGERGRPAGGLDRPAGHLVTGGDHPKGQILAGAACLDTQFSCFA